MKNKKLYQSKTLWTGVSAVVAAVGGYMSDTMDIGMAIQTALGGLAAIFLRSGIREE